MADDASSNKIEPTLTPVADAPSIAASPLEAPALEAAKPDPVVAEAPKIFAEAVASEAPTLPRAPQLTAEPRPEPPAFIASRASAAAAAPLAAAKPRGGRFTLLAATVAIAASLGAIAGSYGGAKFGNTPAEATPRAAKDSADETKALKETVAQLRAATKTLSDNLASLKQSIGSSNTQLAKIAETVERIDRSRAAAAPAAAAAPETTGSIKPPVTLGDPPSTLKHPIVPGWTLRRVYDGAALIEGREGVIEVEPGTTLPNLGRIESIKKQDGRWVVLTSKGLIVGPAR